MATKKLNKADRLFEIFCGEAVSISLDRDLEKTTSSRTKIETLKTSQTVHGYLVDYDDYFFYLGYEPESYDQAVKKDYIVHVELMENPMDEILDDFETPKDEKGYN